jgi:Domain of unknown function (DUF4375)
MTSSTKELENAINVSFEMLKTNGRDIARLPDELRTVVRVVSARGVIGNGGMRYFFERDWEGAPAYDEFVAAFRTVGANELADKIERIVQSFDIKDPHLDGARRHVRFCELFDSDPTQVEFPLSDLCDILEKTDAALETYVANRRSVFTNN